jgi:DNA polymerase-3 subunit beta
MKLTIEKDALVRALGRLHRIVERRNTVAILSNVLLSCEGARLSLKVTDMDIEATDAVAADVAEKGSTSVPAHLLNDIVKKLPEGGAVTLSLDPGEGRLHLQAGRSRFQLPCLRPDEFPTLESGGLPVAFDLPRQEFKALLEKVQAAISTEETRYYLNGVHLHVSEGEEGLTLYGVATDGHRLGVASMPAPDGSGSLPPVIVPRKAVAEALKLADDSVETVGIMASSTKLRLTFGGVVLVTKLIDGTFPDYQRVIPKGNDKVVAADRTGLMASIDRVSTVSMEKGRAIGLSLSQDSVELSVSHPDSGSATEEFPVGYDGAPLRIGFNARYLMDVLSAFDVPEVEIRLGEAGGPATFHVPGGGGLLYVLMPMRI